MNSGRPSPRGLPELRPGTSLFPLCTASWPLGPHASPWQGRALNCRPSDGRTCTQCSGRPAQLWGRRRTHQGSFRGKQTSCKLSAKQTALPACVCRRLPPVLLPPDPLPQPRTLLPRPGRVHQRWMSPARGASTGLVPPFKSCLASAPGGWKDRCP